MIVFFYKVKYNQINKSEDVEEMNDMIGVMIGSIMCVLGLYSLIRGKLPFIKNITV